MTDYLPILLVALFAVTSFIFAMTRGAFPILASGLGLLATLVIGVFCLNLLITIKGNSEVVGISWTRTLAFFAAGLIPLLFFTRLIAKLLILRLLGDNENKRKWLGGFMGGCLSQFSVAIGAIFLFSGFRIAATVAELNYTASLAREQVVEMGGNIPAYPRSVDWRDKIEAIPFVAGLLDRIDPFSNREYRNAAAMVMVAPAPSLRGYFIQDQNIIALARAGKFWDVSQDPSVAEMLRAQDRLGLVVHRKIRQSANRSGVGEQLRELQLRGYLEGFVDSLIPASIGVEEPNL
jgi:hypothetical protein